MRSIAVTSRASLSPELRQGSDHQARREILAGARPRQLIEQRILHMSWRRRSTRRETAAIDFARPMHLVRTFMQSHPIWSHNAAQERAMIDLYSTTPNGHEITLFLEGRAEIQDFPDSIGKGDQFKPEFLAIAPNNRIPAMVDHEPKCGRKPISIFESGAMLLYLAENTGKFLPADLYGRYDAIQWTFWQLGGFGPMAGQTITSELRPGKINRHRPLCERDATGSMACSAASFQSRVHRRALLDRGMASSLGGCRQGPEPEHRRLPASEALARDHPRAAGDCYAPTRWQEVNPNYGQPANSGTEGARACCSARPAAAGEVAEKLRPHGRGAFPAIDVSRPD